MMDFDYLIAPICESVFRFYSGIMRQFSMAWRKTVMYYEKFREMNYYKWPKWYDK